MFQILSPEGKVINKKEFNSLSLETNDCLEIYRLMLLTRIFEEKATKEAFHNHMPIFVSPRGQEAAEVASAYALGKEDWAFFYARSQGVAFSRGISVESVLKFFYGIFDAGAKKDFLSHHTMFPYILVGSYLTHASGIAWASKISGSKPIVSIPYFGEGATAQGDFHSAMNFASIHNIPTIFFCENNQYAISTPNELQTATKTFAEKADAYDIAHELVDGNDPFAVYAVTKYALDRAREKSLPTLIEAVTYRLAPHTTAIGAVKKPPKEEYDEALRKEPLKRMKKFLLSEAEELFGIKWTEEEDRQLREKISSHIEKTIKATRSLVKEIDGSVIISRDLKLQNQPCIDNKYKDIKGVEFNPQVVSKISSSKTKDGRDARDAINFAYFDVMNFDERVVTIGQDIGDIGGVFRTVALPQDFVDEYLPEFSQGVINKFLPLKVVFGGERCIDAPLDESGIVGHAIGLALSGLRPIVEIQFSGFVFECVDQIMGQLAKMFHRGGGLINMPVVIRLPFGGGRFIEHHRESEAAVFLNAIGLTIVCPSTVQDFYDLFWASVASNKPVLFFENKNLYRLADIRSDIKRRTPLKPVEEFGVRVAREGNDVTVIAYGSLVQNAQLAAEIVEKENISAEVIDLRIISPLDKDGLISSIKKTGRIVIVHEEPKFGGIGAEIVAAITESDALFSLETTPCRVAPETYFPDFIAWRDYIPQPEDIVKAIKKVVNS